MNRWGKGESDSLLRGPASAGDSSHDGRSIPIKSQGRWTTPLRGSTLRTICRCLLSTGDVVRFMCNLSTLDPDLSLEFDDLWAGNIHWGL
jgi:hypothetical protein